MNRIQVYILTGLSALFLLFVVANLFLSYRTSGEQVRMMGAQHDINESRGFGNNLKQLAIRVLQDSKRTNDPGLKSLLERQHIVYGNPPSAAPGALGMPSSALGMPTTPTEDRTSTNSAPAPLSVPSTP
jgi:hypothetical protein